VTTSTTTHSHQRAFNCYSVLIPVGIASGGISKPKVLSLDAPTGSNLSFAMTIRFDVWSLGFAMQQIYDASALRAVDVGTRMWGTVTR
jgi:hypothetical protein